LKRRNRTLKCLESLRRSLKRDIKSKKFDSMLRRRNS
jgi:hypothetical protein